MALYFDPSLPLETQRGFATGVASAFELAGDELVLRTELALSPNTRSALLAVAFAARVDDGMELRVRFDRREYQRSLIRLGDLFNAARRAGHGVRIAL